MGLVNTFSENDALTRHIPEFSYVIKILNFDQLALVIG